jgi:hypothetical protein
VRRECLDEFCSAYLDDVLIYSKTLDDHKTHVRKLVTKLGEAGLYMDIDKCHLAVKEVKYLGLILTAEGIKMDASQVKAILDWQLPTTLKELQAFLGFAKFYRRFIVAYSFTTRLVTDLTRGSDMKNNLPTEQRSLAHEAFEKVKKAFTMAPVLAHFNPDLEMWVETDSSDTVTASVLSQVQPDGVLKPVAFISQKMSPVECNYAIYDKELMAIIKAFEEWRPELRATYYLVSQHYYWPLMTDIIAKYTRECKSCRRGKPYKDNSQGLLHELPIPDRYWTDILVNFITPLPKWTRLGKAYEHVMFTVDKFSKNQKYIPLASLEVKNVVSAFAEYV